MDYRREIDGLRALAVMPVILFHAGFETFSGGFVGVDVFFVISGYLITTIILSELEQDKFSIVNFYERRARRIIPVLFFVMLVCIAFSWLWLLPNDMKDFSKSLVAVSVFASNILFWRESSYFDTATELKPLLHTWSLAVEEQYYVLFPLFLIVVWKLGKRWILALLGLAFVTSLGLAQWASYTSPAAAFFLLPTRGWELLVGAFSAFYLTRVGVKDFGGRVREIFGWSGLAMIGYSVFAYDSTTPFPGFYALVPTVGAVLIILFANQNTAVGKFVGNKVFVGIGLISYSAYLWHQPMFSFARHLGYNNSDVVVFLGLTVTTLVLAFFSWKHVEGPFRDRSFISRKSVFLLTLVGSLFFVTFGVYGYKKNGFEGRFERVLEGDIGHLDFHRYIDEKFVDCEPRSVAEHAQSWEGFLRCKQSKSGTPEVVLLGDSHAEHLFLGLAEYLPETNVAFYTLGGKPYLENKEFGAIYQELLSNGQPQNVILTMHFVGHLNSVGDGLYEGFSSSIKALVQSGKTVTLLGDIPRFDLDPGFCVYGFQHRMSSCVLSLAESNRQRSVYEETLQRLAEEFGLQYIRIDGALCSDAGCGMSRDASILYRDNHHLNIPGSKMVGKYLSERLHF